MLMLKTCQPTSSRVGLSAFRNTRKKEQPKEKVVGPDSLQTSRPFVRQALESMEKQPFGCRHQWPECADVHDPRWYNNFNTSGWKKKKTKSKIFVPWCMYNIYLNVHTFKHIVSAAFLFQSVSPSQLNFSLFLSPPFFSLCLLLSELFFPSLSLSLSLSVSLLLSCPYDSYREGCVLAESCSRLWACASAMWEPSWSLARTASGSLSSSDMGGCFSSSAKNRKAAAPKKEHSHAPKHLWVKQEQLHLGLWSTSLVTPYCALPQDYLTDNPHIPRYGI